MTCHASSLSITSPCVFVTDKTFALVNVVLKGVFLGCNSNTRWRYQFSYIVSFLLWRHNGIEINM